MILFLGIAIASTEVNPNNDGPDKFDEDTEATQSNGPPIGDVRVSVCLGDHQSPIRVSSGCIESLAKHLVSSRK